MPQYDEIYRPEDLELESARIRGIENFIESALNESLPDDLTYDQSRRVSQLLLDCDVLFVHRETETDYMYYRYRYEYPDEKGFITAIQYYIVREKSPERVAWYGAPKHEVAVDMEYMPLPGDEEAIALPFTYQPLGSTDEILDFVICQAEHVDEKAEDYELEIFDT